jgi:hypothetical protein
MERKPILLNALARCFELEQAFLDSFDPTERARQGTFENWSPKDVLVHNAVWKAHLVDNLEAIRQGEPPDHVEDFDHANALIYAQHQDKTWNQSLEFAREAHSRLYAWTEKSSEKDLVTEGTLPWQPNWPLWRLFLSQGFNHPLIHLSDYHRQHGDARRSAELLGEMVEVQSALDDSPQWQAMVQYNRACQYALLGRKDEAIDSLREALKQNPSLTEWSRQDPDLESLHGEPGYEAITT